MPLLIAVGTVHYISTIPIMWACVGSDLVAQYASTVVAPGQRLPGDLHLRR